MNSIQWNSRFRERYSNLGNWILRMTQHFSTSPSYFLPHKCLSANLFLPSHKPQVKSKLGLPGEESSGPNGELSGEFLQGRAGLEATDTGILVASTLLGHPDSQYLQSHQGQQGWGPISGSPRHRYGLVRSGQ